MKTSPLFADDLPAVTQASAYLTQFALIWLLIFFLFRAFKRKTTGWIIVGTCSGVFLTLAALVALTGGYNKSGEGAKAGLLIAVVSFIPFSIIMAIRRKTLGWIIAGTLGGLCFLTIMAVVFSVFSSMQQSKRTLAVSTLKSQGGFSDASVQYPIIKGDDDFFTRLGSPADREIPMRAPFDCIALFEPGSCSPEIQSEIMTTLHTVPDLRMMDDLKHLPRHAEEFLVFKFVGVDGKWVCSMTVIAQANPTMNAIYDFYRLKFDRDHGLLGPTYAAAAMPYFKEVYDKMPTTYYLEGGWLDAGDSQTEAASKVIASFQAGWLSRQQRKSEPVP